MWLEQASREKIITQTHTVWCCHFKTKSSHMFHDLTGPQMPLSRWALLFSTVTTCRFLSSEVKSQMKIMHTFKKNQHKLENQLILTMKTYLLTWVRWIWIYHKYYTVETIRVYSEEGGGGGVGCWRGMRTTHHKGSYSGEDTMPWYYVGACFTFLVY